MSTSPSNLAPGLRSTSYVLERNHSLLSADAHKPEGPNIGYAGKNLTILILSLNRSGLSLNLLRSISEQLPNFAGHVLIADNGSAPHELDLLRQACAKMHVPARVLELGANYGVAGGRNRGIAQVPTDWVMCLDNDMYFVGNPLDAIQRDIATLGCHFLNLPLLDKDGRTIFARGGHLYLSVDGEIIRIGAGSVYAQGPYDGQVVPAFLSTFLFGGASVFNRHTFAQLGGFDEGMFVGFEDIDFSIRLFQAGLKVGNTGVVALVHDHQTTGAAGDHEYERQRFSRDTLKKSADHLEAKHGLVVWGTVVDEWLKTRQRELGVEEEPAATEIPPAPLAATPRARPKIALVIDVEGWAFWNISQQLCRHLGDRFDFQIVNTSVLDNVVHVFLAARECDIIHVFWREYLRLITAPHARVYVDYIGCDHAKFIEHIRQRVVSTCIYDHLYVDEASLSERRAFYHEFVDAYYVGSQRLRAIYERVPDFRRPLAVLEDGVDLTLFGPQRLERLDHLGQREIVLGWAGNSNWSSELGDFKGVHTILKPAVAELQAEGLPVRLLLADAAERRRSHYEMVDYYSQIDAYVCTSKIEGTPNPVLEAMACGVPIITTDVGIVPQAFGPQQREFILNERSVAGLKDAIRRLIGSPALFRTLSSENLQQIQGWDWRLKTQGFADFFNECLRQRAERRQAGSRP